MNKKHKGVSGGPYAAGVGCAGFAGFSWVIEHFMEPSPLEGEPSEETHS